MSGLGVVGRDRYGVFPLKGKILNVREASLKQVRIEKIMMLIIFNAFRLCVQGLHPCQGFCFFHIYARKNHCLPHQIMENAEINNIIKILGLQYKKNYSDPESLKTLRYGKIMIMTDQVCQQLKSQKCVLRSFHFFNFF